MGWAARTWAVGGGHHGEVRPHVMGGEQEAEMPGAPRAGQLQCGGAQHASPPTQHVAPQQGLVSRALAHADLLEVDLGCLAEAERHPDGAHHV